MPDQLRWDFVGCYGKPYAHTPNIDALASRGLLYNRCISPSPVCIPARASMLTGHNSISTGVLNNNYWLRPDHDDLGVPSFASLLSDAGYHTEAIGKMHFIPWDKSEGFDHRVIAEDKRHIHIRDDYHHYLRDHGLRKYAGPEEPGYVEGRMASVSLVPIEHQVDTWVGERSVEFIKTYDKDKPFFLWTSFPGPHDPYNPPQEILNDVESAAMPEAFKNTTDTLEFRQAIIDAHADGSAQIDISNFTPAMKQRIRRHYQGLIRIIDKQVGDIVRTLDTLNNGRETLIVFASDHGDFLGDYDFLGKVLFFESSLRVPMIVSGAHVKTGRSDALVSLSDVFSTFTCAAGVKIIAQDSIPLPGIGYGDTQRQYVMGATDMGYMICTNQLKLSRYYNGVTTLHDIVDDPQEQDNLFNRPEYSEQRDSLDRHLTAWLTNSIMDGHADKEYPYMTMNPDHPGHRRGWHRTYPQKSSSWKNSPITF
ncbi:MAG: sulfatase-like hydrolase/transferase [Granulosicoccus sp.]|nr:sulfatase-like hydrolase/transferase [Granulosicoccus sp.]